MRFLLLGSGLSVFLIFPWFLSVTGIFGCISSGLERVRLTPFSCAGKESESLGLFCWLSVLAVLSLSMICFLEERVLLVMASLFSYLLSGDRFAMLVIEASFGFLPDCLMLLFLRRAYSRGDSILR